MAQPITTPDAKPIIIVYTGPGKGKTEAALGLLLRALGSGMSVCLVEFIKSWPTSEDKTIYSLKHLYPRKLTHKKLGNGFYKAGKYSAKNVSKKDHQKAAKTAYDATLKAATSGKYNLVIADEINNAQHEGLITKAQLETLISTTQSHLCLTGRNFPRSLLPLSSIATTMQKTKHHFDDGIEAIKGLDF